MAKTYPTYYVQFGAPGGVPIRDKSGKPITVAIYDYELRGDGPSFSTEGMSIDLIAKNRIFYSVSGLLKDMAEDYGEAMMNPVNPPVIALEIAKTISEPTMALVLESYKLWLERNRKHPVPPPTGARDGHSMMNDEHYRLLEKDSLKVPLADNYLIAVFYNHIMAHRPEQMMAKAIGTNLTSDQAIATFANKAAAKTQVEAVEYDLATGATTPSAATGLVALDD